MNSLNALLGNHPFFKGFSPQLVDNIAMDASEDSFGANQYIFKAWHNANKFYLICKGRVSLEIFDPKHGPVILEIIHAGEALGLSWRHPPYRWRFDARTLEETHVVALDGKALCSCSEENHELGFLLTKRIATVIEQRLQAARLRLFRFHVNSHS